MSECYNNFAWRARGHGYADTVIKEGWRLFEEHTQLAKQTLTAAKKLNAQCPFWWGSMQLVALAEGWNLASYDKPFSEAVTFEPACVIFYRYKVNFLMPRWFGKEGDWQKFAAQSADKTGGEAGDILYARIGWRVHNLGYYTGFQRDSGYSWPRMKKGLEAITRQYPQSLTAASELAFLTYQANDRAGAKPIFERIGTNVDKEVWHDDKPRFTRARTWAFSE